VVGVSDLRHFIFRWVGVDSIGLDGPVQPHGKMGGCSIDSLGESYHNGPGVSHLFSHFAFLCKALELHLTIHSRVTWRELRTLNSVVGTDRIMTKRQILIALLVVEASLAVVHISLRSETEPFLSWHFLAGLVFGAVVVGYAFSVRCISTGCGARQVFRGLSAFDVRLPEVRCYKCGMSLQ